MDHLSGANVLVTGGCGSIGKKLVRSVLQHDPDTIRVLDSNEAALYDLQRELADDRVRFLLGNIRDRDRLRMAIENVDFVFHAAALKHVALNEFNPFETVQTNIQGTQNLIRAAIDETVEGFVTISTDKAASPVSVMGATKLLSERLTVAGNTYKGSRETEFGCVRFGNVLGTSGSVIPTFLDQISRGGPVTVTDPEMTRFVMPASEAVELVLDAQTRLGGGEVFVLKMPALRIGTLAETMIDAYAPEVGYDPDEIQIDVVGPRPGERTHETLVSSDELEFTHELNDMYAILPQIDVAGYDATDRYDQTTLEAEYTSADGRLLGSEEIIDAIERTDAIEAFRDRV